MAAALLVSLPVVASAGADALGFVLYHAARGLGVESTSSNLAFALHVISLWQLFGNTWVPRPRASFASSR